MAVRPKVMSPDDASYIVRQGELLDETTWKIEALDITADEAFTNAEFEHISFSQDFGYTYFKQMCSTFAG